MHIVNLIFYGLVIFLGYFAIRCAISKKHIVSSCYHKMVSKLSAPSLAVIFLLLTTIHACACNWVNSWLWLSHTSIFRYTLSSSNLIFVIIIIMLYVVNLTKSHKIYIPYFTLMLLVNILNTLNGINMWPESIPFPRTISVTLTLISIFILIALLVDEVRQKQNKLTNFLPIIITTLLGETSLISCFPTFELSSMTIDIMVDIYIDVLFGEALLLAIAYIVMCIKELTLKNSHKLKILLSCSSCLLYIFIFPIYLCYNTYPPSSITRIVIVSISWFASAFLFMMIHFSTFIAPKENVNTEEKIHILYMYFMSMGLILSYGFLSSNELF